MNDEDRIQNMEALIVNLRDFLCRWIEDIDDGETPKCLDTDLLHSMYERVLDLIPYTLKRGDTVIIKQVDDGEVFFYRELEWCVERVNDNGIVHIHCDLDDSEGIDDLSFDISTTISTRVHQNNLKKV